MEMYHGTSVQAAEDIEENGVDVTKGGGELGQGFYVGDLMYKACAWAWNKYTEQPAIIRYQINDEEFVQQDVLCLSREAAKRKRFEIKKKNSKRSHKFNVAAVWAPVVGIDVENFNQIKFEKKGKKFIDEAYEDTKKLKMR